MIVDFGEGPILTNRVFDVCLVGGGIAGLTCASELAKAGIETIVVEAGGVGSEPPTVLGDVRFARRVYAGAFTGRRVGLGGTGSIWGGAIIPYLPEDFYERTWIGAPAWAIDHKEILKWWSLVEQTFLLEAGPYEEGGSDDAHEGKDVEIAFIERLAKWPSFGRRNPAHLLERELTMRRNLTIVTHARAVAFELDRTACSIQKIIVANERGNRSEIAARWFVICAGALETTRLLLLLDRQIDGRLCDGNFLGKFFGDHLSLPLGRIRSHRVHDLNRAVGLRFCRRGMRSVRFELHPASQKRLSMPSCWVHIAPATETRSGLHAVRDLLRAWQRSRELHHRLVIETLSFAPYLARCAYWRVARRRLLWPRNAVIEMHVVVEQRPRWGNQVRLADEKDALGVPVLEIDWDVSEEDLRDAYRTAALFARWWAHSSFASMRNIVMDASLLEENAHNVTGIGGIFHPVGTTRMALNATTGVVDRDLQVFNTTNLSVLSTTVFPAVGGANPTGTLVALAFRHAEFLRRHF